MATGVTFRFFLLILKIQYIPIIIFLLKRFFLILKALEKLISVIKFKKIIILKFCEGMNVSS